MSVYYQITVKKETKEKFLRAMKTYREENPNDKRKVTEDFMTDRILEYWLNEGKII